MVKGGHIRQKHRPSIPPTLGHGSLRTQQGAEEEVFVILQNQIVSIVYQAYSLL